MDKKELNRRRFLQTSLISGAGVLIAPSLFANADSKRFDPKPDEKPIIKRKLGNTGIELPIVSFGVMRADSPALIRAAIKEGIVLFDTAHAYQNGKNEEMLGEVLKDYPRDSFLIATKVVPEGMDNKTGQLGPDATSKAFLEKFDLSLKRLKMDYVDILYVHNIARREAALNSEMLAAVTEAKKSGKAKHVGISTHRNEPEVIKAAIESGVYEVVLSAINFKQDYYEELKKAIGLATDAGIGIIAMKTMAGGFQDKERKKPINCKAALKFVLQDENVTTAIPGNTNFDQLTMNASVNRDLEMTAEEKADLAMGASQGGLFCQGCEKCIPDCPKALPIPDIMRAYMYTYGYSNAYQAQTLLAELGLHENPCSDCSVCTVECAKNFKVNERIADVMRLTTVPQEFLG